MRKKITVVGITAMLVAVTLLTLIPTASATTLCNVYHYNPGEDPGWTNCTDGAIGTSPSTSHVNTWMWLLNKVGYNQVGYTDIIKVTANKHDYPAFATATFPEMVNNYDIDTNWSGWSSGDVCLVYSESVSGIDGQSLGQDYIGVGQHTLTFASPQDLCQIMLEPVPDISQNGANLEWLGMRHYADEDLDYATWEDRTDALIGYQV